MSVRHRIAAAVLAGALAIGCATASVEPTSEASSAITDGPLLSATAEFAHANVDVEGTHVFAAIDPRTGAWTAWVGDAVVDNVVYGYLVLEPNGDGTVNVVHRVAATHEFSRLDWEAIDIALSRAAGDFAAGGAERPNDPLPEAAEPVGNESSPSPASFRLGVAPRDKLPPRVVQLPSTTPQVTPMPGNATIVTRTGPYSPMPTAGFAAQVGPVAIIAVAQGGAEIIAAVGSIPGMTPFVPSPGSTLPWSGTFGVVNVADQSTADVLLAQIANGTIPVTRPRNPPPEPPPGERHEAWCENYGRQCPANVMRALHKAQHDACDAQSRACPLFRKSDELQSQSGLRRYCREMNVRYELSMRCAKLRTALRDCWVEECRDADHQNEIDKAKAAASDCLKAATGNEGVQSVPPSRENPRGTFVPACTADFKPNPTASELLPP